MISPSEVNIRAVFKVIELIDKFKMAVGDVINIRGYVMKYKQIQRGIKREFAEIWCRL